MDLFAVDPEREVRSCDMNRRILAGASRDVSPA